MDGEYRFEFFAYPLNELEAEELQEAFQQAIIAVAEKAGKYVSPVNAEYHSQEADHGDQSARP